MNEAGFATVNPSTGEEIEAFSYFTPAQTEKVVARADKSFQSLRELPVHKRAQLFTDLGNTLRKNKVQLAKVISTEMGKIFSEAEAEIEKCAHEADWYAEHGPKIMADGTAPPGGCEVCPKPHQSLRTPRHPRFPPHLARALHDADARLLDRHIQSSKIGHAALLLLMLEAADADLVSPSA